MKAATKRKVQRSTEKYRGKKRNSATGRVGSDKTGQNHAKPRTQTENRSEFRAREKGLGLRDNSYYTIIVINLYRRSSEWKGKNGQRFTSGSARRNRTQRARKRS